MNLVNSTIVGNETASDGGGIANESDMTIVNGTIYGNSAGDTGGGIFGAQFTSNSLTNTIVAGNYQAVTPDDMTGAINDNSAHNLIGDGNGLSGISNGSNGNQVGQQNALIDPKLAPLGNYGGPTPTVALLSGSPAIDAGTTTVPGGLPVSDQRGFTRTINGNVDIGAVECQYDLGLAGLTPESSPGTDEYVYIVTNVWRCW